ncbi:MAG: tRNA preQ1(34) S-adenosylmethionine ribosyltransferase-isomerase QueA [bacterium]|nr:tRNA preQ1(34) S-adenosylmethionine ribosyltransferase-isomerase QueA [bacterium]
MFDYHLPKELIAQYPFKKRDKARLMVLNRNKGEIKENIFNEITEYFEEGDTLVLNDSKVIPARLRGKKNTGGKIEIFLLRKTQPYIWEVLIRGNIKQKQECEVIKENRKLSLKILERTATGSYIIEFPTDKESEIFNFGEIPLPPYIKRKPEKEDDIFYQTVYGKKEGSVAAPTAGLHFTNPLLGKIENKGINITYITLHIGWASFKILRDTEKEVGEEFIEISEEASKIINKTKKEKRRVIAVGTSTVRTLESSVKEGRIIPSCGYTDLFIKPGFKFKIVDALITNFHLPGSTHLLLVCAFGGTHFIEKAYKIAIEKKYRFYSYGDAMLIV